jgi:FAD/FMN-containing dehydrogenase
MSTLRCDRILAFDPTSGRITAETGLMLAELIDFALPRGFFPPVTPGTRLLTLGGMIAADVHGKNHHRDGSFGQHVEEVLLLCGDGETRRCSPQENPALFWATIGGMGLTGVILEATFRLAAAETAWIRQETLRAPDLESAMESLAACEDWTYTVAWIDCLARGARLGRSLIFCGEHANAAEAPADPPRIGRERSLPVDVLSWTLNRASMTAFNEVYYRRGRPGTAFVPWNTYFYPLDAVRAWNRIYGRAGFAQYQFVVPRQAGHSALRMVLDRVAQDGDASFLAVLKLFGAQGKGMMSFPTEGWTLTVDFPLRARTLNLMLELDAIVADHGGRLYLAKDSRAGAASIRAGYPCVEDFARVRDSVDPQRRFSSLLSQRLGL